jgi:polar amino acid transport system substrate-binding protein
MVELAEEALTRAGYRVQFKVTPWTRALGDMDSGAANAVVGIYFAQARQRKYVVPAEDLGVSANAIYVAAGSSWKYSRPASLESMVLATIADYDYGELNAYIAQALKENSPRVQVMFGNGALEKNLKKLVAGRVTALVEDRVVVAYVARRMGFLGRIRSAGDVNPENPAGVAFSPRDPRAAEYARALSEGIEKLRASGELRKVLQRYGVADWK